MNDKNISKRKILRNKLINNLFEKFDQSKINNKTLGAWVKAWHYTAPIGTLGCVFACNKLFATIALVGGTIAGILIFILQGCFLSQLEYKLTGDKSDNITNIFLEYFNYDINKKNQTKMTYIILSVYLPLMYLTYYFRFIRKNSIINNII